MAGEDGTPEWQKVVECYRHLTLKKATGCLLTDKEAEWLLKATKALYGAHGIYAYGISRYMEKKLAGTVPYVS